MPLSASSHQVYLRTDIATDMHCPVNAWLADQKRDEIFSFVFNELSGQY